MAPIQKQVYSHKRTNNSSLPDSLDYCMEACGYVTEHIPGFIIYVSNMFN